MQKIMFNDKLGLTQAVLEGRKTQTRREIKCPRTQHGIDVAGFEVHKFSTGFREVITLDYDGREIGALEPTYKIGEVIAIAQSYKEVPPYKGHNEYCNHRDLAAGWNNKMFVKAYRMPHHIRITGIRVEHLQDISEEDCIKEGIYEENPYDLFPLYKFHGSRCFPTAYGAYEELVNKLDRWMWKQNPLVWVYEFKLVD